jgi:hypothetical protein
MSWNSSFSAGTSLKLEQKSHEPQKWELFVVQALKEAGFAAWKWLQPPNIRYEDDHISAVDTSQGDGCRECVVYNPKQVGSTGWSEGMMHQI